MRDPARGASLFLMLAAVGVVSLGCAAEREKPPEIVLASADGAGAPESKVEGESERGPRAGWTEAAPKPSAPSSRPDERDPFPVHGKIDPAIRASLEAKAWAGRASLEELKMLRAICTYEGDKECRERALAMLKARQPKP